MNEKPITLTEYLRTDNCRPAQTEHPADGGSHMVQAVMSGAAADYVIDLLNTEMQSLQEELNEHANSNPTGCAGRCQCVEARRNLELVEEAYGALRGDNLRSNTDTTKVFTIVQHPDGTETHHENEYDARPLLIGLETTEDQRRFLTGDMATNYRYWHAMFGGDFNFLNGKESR